MKSVVVVCLVLCFAIFAQALKCYTCRGEAGGDCANGVPSVMEEVECTEQGALAQCFQQDLRTGSNRAYSRGCTKQSNPDLCTLFYQLAAQFPIALNVFSCSLCDTELCNNKIN